MPGCSVPGCTNNGGHRFPQDKERREKWIIAIKRMDPGGKKLWEPTANARVCKSHFTEKDFKPLSAEVACVSPVGAIEARNNLRDDAVPSLLLSRGRAKRASTRFKNSKMKPSDKAVDPDFSVQLEVVDKDQSDKEPLPLDHRNPSTSAFSGTLQVKSTTSLLERHKNCDGAIRFYTGFKNYSHFEFFFHILGFEAYDLECKSITLAPKEQLFMTFIKLRHAKDDLGLSLMFNMCSSQVGILFNCWLSLMFNRLKEIHFWPESETIKSYMPEDLRERFSSTRVIQDHPIACKVVKVNTPHLLSGGKQQSEEVIIKDWRTSSKKVHIGRLIELSKTFKILKSALHRPGIEEVYKIVFVCAAISDFKDIILYN